MVITEDPDNPGIVPVTNRMPDPRRVDIVVPLDSNSEFVALPRASLPDTKKARRVSLHGLVCLPVIQGPEALQKALSGVRG